MKPTIATLLSAVIATTFTHAVHAHIEIDDNYEMKKRRPIIAQPDGDVISRQQAAQDVITTAGIFQVGPVAAQSTNTQVSLQNNPAYGVKQDVTTEKLAELTTGVSLGYFYAGNDDATVQGLTARAGITDELGVWAQVGQEEYEFSGAGSIDNTFVNLGVNYQIELEEDLNLGAYAGVTYLEEEVTPLFGADSDDEEFGIVLGVQLDWVFFENDNFDLFAAPTAHYNSARDTMPAGIDLGIRGEIIDEITGELRGLAYFDLRQDEAIAGVRGSLGWQIDSEWDLQVSAELLDEGIVGGSVTASYKF